MHVLVWDSPTRLFHGLFACSFVVAWLTSGDDRWLDVHVFAGYVLGSLLAFRLLWGFIGSRYARFSTFAFTPGQALAYLNALLRHDAMRYIGHNPAGSWAIYLLLALGLLLSVSGVLVLGGEEGHGPLAGLLGFAAGACFKQVHMLLAWLMLGLVALHLLGVVVESCLHGENLPRAILTGRKPGCGADAIASARRGVGVVLLMAVAGAAAWYFKGYFNQPQAQPHLPFVGKALPDNRLWRAECGSCHLAYHPVLLPARSWQRMLREQNTHFGEALGLDAPTIREILSFLTRYSADAGMTEAAYQIGKSIPPAAAPLRISDTAYWKNKHAEMSDAVWRDKRVGTRANCAACHLDAELGTFEDAAMRLPK